MGMKFRSRGIAVGGVCFRFLCLGVISIGIAISPNSVVASGLGPERASVASLPAKAGAHWVWVNDLVLSGVADGKSKLIDADSGKMLGLLNTGFLFGTLTLPSHQREIYATETYFARGTRGKRTDVLTIYDPSTLSPIDEIEIPSKKASGIPMSSYYGITDDDRFALVYNFTPAQSVSVIDLKNRSLASEIETAGCALVFPSGARRFQMICANGQMLTVELGESGKLKRMLRSEPFFDPLTDPVTEKAVRFGDTWLFVSFDGYIYPVNVAEEQPRFDEKWSLFSREERAASWKIGGVQHLAIHRNSGILFTLVHEGGPDSHKDGGMDVWLYDVKRKQQTKKIGLENLATSIQVTQDDSPLLFSVMFASSTLDVYEAWTGNHLRAIEEVGTTPTILQVP